TLHPPNHINILSYYYILHIAKINTALVFEGINFLTATICRVIVSLKKSTYANLCYESSLPTVFIINGQSKYAFNPSRQRKHETHVKKAIKIPQTLLYGLSDVVGFDTY